MVQPTIKEPTGTTPGGAQKWGGPDAVQAAQIMKGTHATERLQHEAIEKQVQIVTSTAGTSFAMHTTIAIKVIKP